MENKRPGFLTTLCVLSYIGCGLGIIGGIFNLVTLPGQIEGIKALIEMTAGMAALGPELEAQVKALENYGMLSAGLSLAGSLVCLFGVIKMWKMAKTGFYIYTVGQIIAIVGTFLVMGTSWLASPIIMVFPILFIVLYALNLKHMK
jgi:hypothetical protein